MWSIKIFKKSFIVLLIIVAGLLIGCKQKNPVGGITVVSSIFPQYDFARIIGGDKIRSVLLLPPGIDPHSFDPKPSDLMELKQSSLFIYTGDEMEPWADETVKSVNNTNLRVIKMSDFIGHNSADTHQCEGNCGSHSNHECLGECSHQHGHEQQTGVDPHIWLDFGVVTACVEAIAEELALLDPANADYYRSNADSYIAEITDIDNQYKSASERFTFKTIIFGGHFAFGYLAKRYGLEHVSPYSGFSTNLEPTPAQISAVVDLVRSTGTDYIFYEKFVNPRIARVISDETSTEMLMLHTAANISLEEFEQKTTYIDLMRLNLESLKKGLGYR